MRKSFPFLTALLLGIGLSTASAQSDSINPALSGNAAKNMMKINLLSLPLNNYSLQFERAIGGKTAAGLGLRVMPESGLPLKSAFEDIINDPDLFNQINNFRTGNFSVTPEIRFYLGKSVFRGFYIAPFARYTKFTASLPFSFDVPNDTGGSATEEIPLSGDLSTITAGVLFGAQWKLSKLIYLDWSILGPHYGGSNGKISGSRPLDPEEQTALRDELSTLDDLPLVKTTYTVDQNGATVDFTGPWAGIRANIGIGFRF